MMFPAGLFITSVILGTVSAFPNGAPDIACGEMIPGHLPTGTSGTNPFMFNVSATTYKSGDEISGQNPYFNERSVGLTTFKFRRFIFSYVGLNVLHIHFAAL